MSLKDLSRRLRAASRREPVAEAQGDTSIDPLLLSGASAVARAMSLRNEPLGESLIGLNDQQLRAVFEPSSVLVNAAVGSGKTLSLVHKIAVLLQVDGVSADQMSVMTFTNRAAREMNERLVAMLPANCAAPRLGTYHSLARWYLERSPALERFGRKRGFGVLQEEAKESLLDDLVAEHDLDIRYRSKLNRRVQKGREGVLLYGNMKHTDDLSDLLEHYETQKRERNVLDFDDLIELGIEALEEGLHEPPAWIIVDEFQDADDRLLRFVEALSGPKTRFFLVGDPRQSIYGWRGSSKDTLSEFRSRHQLTECTLSVNYRSTGAILACAGALFGDGLKGARGAGEKIRVLDHHDALSESIFISDRLKSRTPETVESESVAVLFRAHSQQQLIEEALVARGVKFFSVAELGALEEPPAGSVALSTIHAAKGLEFDRVFLVGANEGLLPLIGSRDGVEEERRLFFVAMTRARDSLEISYLRCPSFHGATEEPSQFLAALPQTLIDRDLFVPESVLPKSAWSVGCRIVHPRYGQGEIQAMEKGRLHCLFVGGQEVSLLEKLNPLQRLP